MNSNVFYIERMFQALCLGAMLIAAAFAVQAAPPANDSLANAFTLNGTAGTTNASVVDATTEPSEGAHGMLPTDTVYRTVWFQWTATQTKPVTLEITSASFDAVISVYTGGNYPLQYVIRNNDTFGSRPRVEFQGVSGTTYRIVVGSNNSPAVGAGTFALQWSQNDRPTNDDFAQAMPISGRSGIVSATNLLGSAEAQEPAFGVGRSVWFSFTNNSASDFSVTFTTRRSIDPFFDTTLSVFTGSAVNALTTVVRNGDTPSTYKSRVTFLAKAGTTYRIAADVQNGASPDGNILLSWETTRTMFYTDFGTRIGNSGEVYYDEAADITVFRPSNGVWYSLDSNNGSFSAFKFGLSGDKPVPADFDGDGLTDYAVTRASGGSKVWYVRNSFDGSVTIQQWGLAGDKEMPGDYDGDGRTDIAVYRPSENNWYVLRSSDGQFTVRKFGLAGDIPVLGDFKNTPIGTDIAVFRPSNGTWYVFDGVNTIFLPFGLAGDRPVPADYDGDGLTDTAVFRPSDTTWYFRRSSTDDFSTMQWGVATDVPMIGDYDNNSNDEADFVVFRPGNNTWYVRRAGAGGDEYTQFGAAGDIPVSSLANLMQ